MDYQQIIDNVFKQVRDLEDHGRLADYIEELTLVDPGKFGVSLDTIDGERFTAGDYRDPFSIQSIAKVFSLSMAYELCGDSLWERVGVEPSGTPFNSLVQLEADRGIPRNPLINAGAIVICDYLISRLTHPKKEFLEYVQIAAQNSSITYSKKIAESEKKCGFTNAALINLMKALGNIHNDIDDVLDFYFNLCSIKMNCIELASAFKYLMNGGVIPESNQRILSLSRTKRLNAIMLTCGFYDEAGEFTFKVGLPGKSGVGGGIAAVHPKKYSVAVWSPRLNKKGNSYKGMEFLERFTTETALSIF